MRKEEIAKISIDDVYVLFRKYNSNSTGKQISGIAELKYVINNSSLLGKNVEILSEENIRFFIPVDSNLTKSCCKNTFPQFVPPSQYNVNNRYIYGELFLICLVLLLWLFSILVCLSKYSKLRSLEPFQESFQGNPMNIDNVKIVENEQDTVIYKKKKYSSEKQRILKIVIPDEESDSAPENINYQNPVPIKVISEDGLPVKLPKVRSHSEPNMYRDTSTSRYTYSFPSRLDSNCNPKYFEYNLSVRSHNENELIRARAKRHRFANSRKLGHHIRVVKPRSTSSNSKGESCSLNDPNLLNPNWIPMTVQKRLLYLHRLSRLNLSKSDSNLKYPTSDKPKV